ncbi:uncharacterized protein B0H18DRAFT_860190, partial [Fomitopsis serialis]|uniref:uncharacterized protein n=1 Tax=Fomitopsis serialis TaxID=139415 RepID=UPI0020086F55
YEHPLKQSNPLVVVAIFLALVLQLLGGVTRQMCNFTLHVLKTFSEMAIGLNGPPSPMDQKVLIEFPTDIRTVRRLFDLDPIVTDWAACPVCSMTYEP